MDLVDLGGSKKGSGLMIGLDWIWVSPGLDQVQPFFLIFFSLRITSPEL